MKNEEIVKALRECDWSNTDIGNKAILSAAILALEASPPLPQDPACYRE